ncbi:LysR family transcriptional regulator, partial [Thioclava sp. BHET1]
FTGAAEKLGISGRLASKHVAELEQRIGTRLFQRTTRRLGLTETGLRLLERAPGLLDGFDSLIEEVTETGTELSGTLRVAAPVTYGESYVGGMLARFAQRHPGVSIDLRLADTYTDLAATGTDLAFRIGQLEDTALRARNLREIRMRLVAAPAYLAAHGSPATPEELSMHRCIVDTNARLAGRWRFEREGRVSEIPIQNRFMANSARIARDLALDGHGIANAPDFVLDADIRAGRLVPLLAPYLQQDRALYALYLP